MDAKKLGRWFTRMSALSAWLFAVGLAPIFAYTGPFLAMGIWMYGGETEPNQPDLPFPWITVAVGLIGTLALLVVDLRKPEKRLALVATFTSLLVAAYEVKYLWDLIQAARP